MRWREVTRRRVDDVNGGANIERDTRKQVPQQPSRYEKNDRYLKRRTDETTCGLPRGAVYALTALAKIKAKRHSKEEPTDITQTFSESVQFPLPKRALADLKRRIDAQRRPLRKKATLKTEKPEKSPAPQLAGEGGAGEEVKGRKAQTRFMKRLHRRLFQDT